MPKLGKKLVPRNYSLAQRLAYYSRSDRSGCTVWEGNTTQSGYGVISWEGKSRRAHRMAWEAAHGPIPDDMCVCHRCDVPLCINPDHLFLGTTQDNTADRNMKNRQAKGATLRFATGKAKLTAAQVAEIRSTKRRTNTLSLKHGISRSQIGRIRRGDNWSDA